MKSDFILEDLMAYNLAERNSSLPVWTLVVLPEGTIFLGVDHRIGGRYGREAILFEPFPWELPQTQYYKIVNVQSTLMREEVLKGIEQKLRGHIMKVFVIARRVDRTQKPV